VLGGLDLLEAHVVAAHPAGRLAQRLGHGLGRGGPLQRHLARDQGLTVPGRVDPAGQVPAREQRHREVAVYPLVLGHVGLQAVLEAEHP
jgi:hypothetical protein